MAKGAYGKLKSGRAEALHESGNTKTQVGLTGVAAGAALMATPAAPLGGVMMTAGALTAQDGRTDKRIASGVQAKGKAVDTMVAKGRGGSAVVAQHGGGSRLSSDQASKFATADAHFKTQQHNAGVSADARAGMQGSGKGFGNANNQKAAQAAKAAKRGQ